MEELGAWYVSRYEDVRHVKKHQRYSPTTSLNSAPSGAPAATSPKATANEHGWRRVSTLQRTDPPLHTKYRKLINHAFTVKRIRAMTPYVETVVNDLIDGFIDQGRCDFVWDFAIPLPCTVIADQLGVPREKIWQLKEWSDAMLAPAAASPTTRRP